MNNEVKGTDKEIDFFIPLHRHHPFFQSCVGAVVKFYYPRTIYIVTMIEEIEKLKACVHSWNLQKTILCFLEEETFFEEKYSLSKEEIQDRWYTYKDEQSREFGWWYQQILKLGALSKIPNISDPYIVWDSDLIPIEKWPIYPTKLVPFFQFALLQEKEKSVFNKTQYNASLEDLLFLSEVFPSESKGTFVPHHFIFHHSVIYSFVERVERIHNLHFFNGLNPEVDLPKKTWIEIILTLSKKYYRFSEYRTITTFMNYYYPELLWYHPFSHYGEKGIRIRDPIESSCFVENILQKNIDTNINSISYQDFYKFVLDTYKDNLPSYIQVEHL